jgi:hypothetical protein
MAYEDVVAAISQLPLDEKVQLLAAMAQLVREEMVRKARAPDTPERTMSATDAAP